jgi:hypothetical protein
VIKRFLQLGLLLAGFTSMSAWSIVITDTDAGSDNGTNVGAVDTLIGEISKTDLTTLCGNPGGSTGCETQWANTILSPDVNWTVKVADVDYFTTDQSGVYAFELFADPGYFLIKNSNARALFKNNNKLDWGVFNVASLGLDFNIPSDEFIISHVTSLDGGDNTVPEPGVLALLAVGLLGMAAASRKKTL